MEKTNSLRINRNSLLAIIELCQMTYLDEYSLKQILERLGVSNTEYYISHAGFMYKLNKFIQSLPLSYFSHDKKKRYDLIKRIQDITTKKTTMHTNETSTLNILRPKKNQFNYI